MGRAIGLGVALVCALGVSDGAPISAQPPSALSPDALAALKFRYIGPVGNRVTAVAGVPGDPYIYYAGAASGGIWKTTDGGAHWEPIFDGQPVSSRSARSPSRRPIRTSSGPAPARRSSAATSRSARASTSRIDAGKTWTRMGLEPDRPHRAGSSSIRRTRTSCSPARSATPTGRSRSAASSARPTAARPGTASLFVDENTGCSDIAMDPNEPAHAVRRDVAARDPHVGPRRAAGPAAACSCRRDGGATWTAPERPRPARRSRVGKVAVAIAPSNPNRVYALIETGDGMPWNGQETERGQLWRSDDGGENWTVVSDDRNAAWAAPHYYSRMAVAPDNDERGVLPRPPSYTKSIDGGADASSIRSGRSRAGRRPPRHVDRSDQRATGMIVAHDQGMSIIDQPRQDAGIASSCRSRRCITSRSTTRFPTTSTATSRTGRRIAGRATAGSRAGGRRRSRRSRAAMWHTVGGGESGWATPDPGRLRTSSGRPRPAPAASAASSCASSENRRQCRNVEVWPDQSNGRPPADAEVPLRLDAAAARSRRTITTRSTSAASTCTARRTAARAGR